jgi:hypothetical protein
MSDIEQARECDVERVAFQELRKAWFEGRTSLSYYDSEAVELAWNVQVEKIIAAMQPAIDAAIMGGRELAGYLQWDAKDPYLQKDFSTSALTRGDKSAGWVEEPVYRAIRTLPIDHDPGDLLESAK